MLLVLRDILKQDIPVQSVCQQIRENMDYSIRLELLHFLWAYHVDKQAVMENSISYSRSADGWESPWRIIFL
jgi:DnaJ like chaperone protein